MGIFSPEGPLYKFISRFWDIVVLNFFWLLFSLPIITIGASTTAAFSVALKMVDDEEGYVGRSFIKAFKENFKQGGIIGLLAIAAGYLVYLNAALFNAIESHPLPLILVAILGGIYFYFSFLYAFPLAARYQNTIFKILSNSRRICQRYMLRTIILTILIIILIIFVNINSTMRYFGFLMGPAFIIFMISAFAKRIFQDIDRKNNSE